MATKSKSEAKRIAALKAEDKRAQAAKKAIAKAQEKVAAKRIADKKKADEAAAKALKAAKGKVALSISVNGKVHETKTNDVAKSLLSFPIGHIKTKVIIRATVGSKTTEYVLFNIKAKRVFTQPDAALFFGKRVHLGLGI